MDGKAKQFPPVSFFNRKSVYSTSIRSISGKILEYDFHCDRLTLYKNRTKIYPADNTREKNKLDSMQNETIWRKTMNPDACGREKRSDLRKKTSKFSKKMKIDVVAFEKSVWYEKQPAIWEPVIFSLTQEASNRKTILNIDASTGIGKSIETEIRGLQWKFHVACKNIRKG